MKIQVDNYHKIGDNHVYCEDYSGSGVHKVGNYEVHYAVICDGCSGEKNTDIGSMLLVQAFKRFVFDISVRTVGWYALYPNEMHKDLCYHLKKIIDYNIMTGFDISSFTSTIRGIIVLGGKIFMFNYGDGYTLQIVNNKLQHISSETYPNNTPYYFTDSIDELKKSKYKTKFKDEMVFNKNGLSVPVPEHVNNSQNFYSVMDVDSLEVGDNIFIVASDGFGSFYNNESGDKIDDEIVLNRMFSFKNLVGMFIRRRILKELKNFNSHNDKHYDDISASAILIRKEG